ncbi:glycolate oxidase [Methylomarinovum caldicuralii]|uniref:Glycolate oxidase n=1 Tax=Methylomarinovum caldicuralii TaxID=438856 RepID=A0AAU9CSG6_9GAMM|nr:FAD-linked oxidase C-terminal domain-containing protein [Methylomarinovum caldicuralii]BCX82437.1 glycolate oxidase [Methylomarinovum caldicuralii]
MTRRDAVIRRLQAIVPDEAILRQPEELKPYECDGLTAYRRVPWLVVLPEHEAQLVRILKLCRDEKLPLVVRGAGTGLSGGALPLEEGLLVSLARFDRILELDPVGRTARVQPGVRNLAISEAACPHGLYYAPDPSSQIACSIGGNVAENAGGIHCLKYGLTVHNVIGLRCLTLDGEAVTLGSAGLDGPGYDLLALVHGSEGLLAVVTEVTVRLLPLPGCTRTLLAAFPTVAAAADAVAAVIEAGLIPAAMEMMDRPAILAVEDYLQAGYPREAAALVICELDGPEAQVEAEAAAARCQFERLGAFRVQVARDEAERQRFWQGRKSAFPAIGRITPDYYCMDGTIPRHRVAEVLAGIARLADKYGLRVANVFHAGDGNLHPLIMYDAAAGELEKVEQLGREILDLCVRVGGTITGEHGVGVEKLDSMCRQFGAGELRLFHAVKRAFDPTGLLNPGKAVPTLARCAELGGMHVHRGRLPHPELARF